MPHADSSLVPADITTKPAFYAHIHAQLAALLDGHAYWVSNLAQAASLLYHAYAGSALYGLDDGSPVVNWAGFYIIPPAASASSPSTATSTTPAPAPTTPAPAPAAADRPSPLVLGPYHGRPACITIAPVRGRGVCADAYVGARPVVVDDVEAYPGHIEVVVPLRMAGAVVGVLDLDSVRPALFDDDDVRGLVRVVEILDAASVWA